MSQDYIEEVEMSINEAKKIVNLGKSLERLLANRDFKRVFLEEYLEKEAIRLVHLKGDLNMQSAEHQASILSQMDAISCFTMFMQKLQHQGVLAEKAMEDGENTLDELRQEGSE